MSIQTLMTKMAKNLTTNREYKEFCADTGRSLGKTQEGNPRDNQPVVYVSWFDAIDYCVWLTTKTGLPWRLPTEDELKAEEALIPSTADFSAWPLPELPDVGQHPETTSTAGINDLLGVVYQWTMRPEDVEKYYEAYDKWRNENPELMAQLAKKREEERLAEMKKNMEGAEWMQENFSAEMIAHGFVFPENEAYFGQNQDLIEEFVQKVNAERAAKKAAEEGAGDAVPGGEEPDGSAGTMNEVIGTFRYLTEVEILECDPQAEMNGALERPVMSAPPGAIWETLSAVIIDEQEDRAERAAQAEDVRVVREATGLSGDIDTSRPVTESDKAFFGTFSPENGAVAGKSVSTKR